MRETSRPTSHKTDETVTDSSSDELELDPDTVDDLDADTDDSVQGGVKIKSGGWTC